MTLQVTRDSPPRYFISGAESDSDDGIDEKLVEKLADVQTAEKLLASSASIELVVKFKNPFRSGHSTTKTTINASNYTYDRKSGKIECCFQAPKDRDPIYFAFNHDGRYSKISVMLKSATPQATCISEFTTYLLAEDNPDYTICSDNLRFFGKLTALNEQEERVLKGARKRLFTGVGEAQVVQPYNRDGKTQLGAIFALERAKIILMLNTPAAS
jgi:hypothetical protein